MKIWMEVTRDKYQLPLVIANSAQELAKLCRTTKNNVCSAASKAKKNGENRRYISVDIGKEEDEA